MHAPTEVIVTHANADFDALASQVAARLLYPDAVMVRGRAISRPVRNFLALHKDHFELTPREQIPWQDVTRAILVDVRRRSRLGDFPALLARIGEDPDLEVHVYDHHPEADDDLPGSVEEVEPLGSVTTRMVELLSERGIPVDPIEATLMALGIYADTGSLTFPATTPRDARAAGWLLGRGASLEMVRRYLRPPLSPGQNDAVRGLIERAEVLELGGLRIGVAPVRLDGTVNGLAEVTSLVLELEGFDALFGLFHTGKGVIAVGRAQVPWVDVGSVMMALGGGGHTGAGSARVKGAELEAVRGQVVAELRRDPPRPTRVRHIMTTPVVTVDVATPLPRAREVFDHHGISGAPVLREGRLVGILSRRDIRAAERDERLQRPVASCMTHEVRTVAPDEPLERALEAMTRDDVGRLPVVEGGHIVGIVTRSDILARLYTDTD